MTQPPPPPGWYPDPAGGGGLRWWDGGAWTQQTQPQHTQPQHSQPQHAQPQHTQPQHAQPHRTQSEQVPPGHPRSVLLEQPVLVVQQRAKLVELTNEYAVLDGAGQQVGAVTQVGQSSLRKAFRLMTRWDQFLTHTLEVRDAAGPVLLLTRPAKLMRSRVLVARPDGTPAGEIVQANVVGHIRFDLVVADRLVGAIQAENWRAWDFAVVDAAGAEVARITKTWEGLARTLFTTADDYVVQVHQRLPDPLATLVLASALTVDTALKQDVRGLN